MLTLDIARIAVEKGIKDPSIFMRRLGFGSKYITAILRKKGSVRLSNAQIETLCLALHCTPNDLYSWQEDEGKSIAGGHPIRALVRVKKASIPDLLQSLPPEKIDKVRELMMQLKEEGREVKG